MSSAGRIPAWVIEKQRRELERKREAERLQKVKEQIAQISADITAELTQLAASGVSAWASEEVTAISHVVSNSQDVDDALVDEMLTEVSNSRARVAQITAIAASNKETMKMEIDLRKQSIEGLLIELRTIAVDLQWQEQKTDFQRLISRVEDVAARDIHVGAGSVEGVLDEIRDEMESIRSSDEERSLREELRRHIVASLIASMRELGFVVGKPKLVHEKGRVVVIGTLSSGRTVRFEVADDGGMEFDMDGFSDRKCADHLDEVLAELEANFGVESGPVQHNWKNPDRISKGSKGFPTGGNTRSMGGGQG